MTGRRLLVVGDFMVDQTIYGEASRISPEAPTPVVLVRETRRQLGGAGNVVRNVDSLGGQVLCAGVMGDDDTAGILKELLCGVRACQACCMVQEPGRKTTLKTRVVAVQAGRASQKPPYGHQQVLRLDEETPYPISSESMSKVLDFTASVLSQVDGVVLSDYAKGALAVPLLQQLIGFARGAGEPVFVGPQTKGWDRYSGASVLTPKAVEAEAALGIPFSASEDAVNAGWERTVQDRLEELGLQALLVTRGAEGLSLIDRLGFHHFPTFAREVFDVTGAGDTVLAAFSLAVAAGVSYPQAAQLGNLAAGVAVAKAGSAAV